MVFLSLGLTLSIFPMDATLFFILIVIGILFLGLIFMTILIVSFVIFGDLKGAPFVRSKREKIAVMLELAEIKSNDKVIDAGSGDGTLLLEAAKRGARGIGIEINPFLVWYSRMRARKSGFSETLSFERNDFSLSSFQNASVVFLYLWPHTVEKLKEKLFRELTPEARVISNSFPMKGWIPTKEKAGVYLYHPQK